MRLIYGKCCVWRLVYPSLCISLITVCPTEKHGVILCDVSYGMAAAGTCCVYGNIAVATYIFMYVCMYVCIYVYIVLSSVIA
jgi:hypothetical protein